MTSFGYDWLRLAFAKSEIVCYFSCAITTGRFAKQLTETTGCNKNRHPDRTCFLSGCLFLLLSFKFHQNQGLIISSTHLACDSSQKGLFWLFPHRQI